MRSDKKTSPEVYREVCIRSGGQWINGRCQGGRCENPGCPGPDWRGLQFSHTRHRGMGGTNRAEIHSARNIKTYSRFNGPYQEAERNGEKVIIFRAGVSADLTKKYNGNGNGHRAALATTVPVPGTEDVRV